MTQWAEVHAELRNKIRWAIRTVAPKAGVVIPYSEASEWSSQIATGITEEWRALTHSADSVETDGLIRTETTRATRKKSRAWLEANS